MTANHVGARRPLRIGIFIALLPPEHQGGAELQADRMARELAARGHEVHVFARRQPGGAAREDRAGVRVHRRAVVPVPGLRLAAEVILGAAQAARRKPDVLLCYITMNSGLLGAAASRLCGAPFAVWQRQRGESLVSAGRFERRIAVAIFERAAGLWVQTESFARTVEAELARAGRRSTWERLSPRVRVLGNGIDLPSNGTPEPPAAPPRFLFVGRLVGEKDLPTLVTAMRRLDGAELWLAGDGPLRSDLESMAAGAPVRFLGEVSHARVPDLLRESRALVLCSSVEGVPNVVLEALAHARPVIATPVGAIPELVQDGVNGRLVPVGDAEALAAAMRDLLDDATWRALAGAARPSVEKFSWPRLVDEVESELEALVRDSRRRT